MMTDTLADMLTRIRNANRIERPWVDMPATRLKAAPYELIPMFLEPEINIVVVGGEADGYWQIMGAKHRAAISVDDWR